MGSSALPCCTGNHERTARAKRRTMKTVMRLQRMPMVQSVAPIQPAGLEPVFLLFGDLDVER